MSPSPPEPPTTGHTPPAAAPQRRQRARPARTPAPAPPTGADRTIRIVRVDHQLDLDTVAKILVIGGLPDHPSHAEIRHTVARVIADTDDEDALLTEIAQRLAACPQDLDGRAARWVIFTVQEWDNGYFLTGSDATVYFADGDQVPFDFHGSCVDDILTDMYGARGSTAALGVDLRTGAVEFDDYHDNVPDLLGIPTRGHRIS